MSFLNKYIKNVLHQLGILPTDENAETPTFRKNVSVEPTKFCRIISNDSTTCCTPCPEENILYTNIIGTPLVAKVFKPIILK